MKRGKLIVIEGTDCSGKETQAKELVKKLNEENLKSVYMTFPQYGTPTGDFIANYYLGKDGRVPEFGPSNLVDAKIASSWYAMDRRNAIPEIMRNLSRGKNIICDRYVGSNMGHQGGKIRDPKERLEFYNWLEKLEYEDFFIPKPDTTIFLYVPYQIGMQLKKGRIGIADGHEKDPEHLKNAEEAYLQLANHYSWEKINCVANGKMRSVDDIQEEIYPVVKKILES